MITKEKMQFLRMPDGDVTGGGVVAEPPANRGMAALEDPPVVEPVVEEDEPVVEPVVPVAPVVDAAALAKSFGEVLADKFKTPEPTPKTVDTLSPEEAKKLLNVWEPTKEWLARYDNLETREAAIAEQRDGMVKHVDTISQYRMREMQTAMDKKFGPVLSYMAEQRELATSERFNKTYPVLADPALGALIKTVAGTLTAQGKTYDDEKVLFKDIADGVEAVIKVTNPNFKLTAGSTPAKTKTTSQSANSIPVTTPGAGGGTAVRQPTAPKARGLAVFDA